MGYFTVCTQCGYNDTIEGDRVRGDPTVCPECHSDMWVTPVKGSSVWPLYLLICAGIILWVLACFGMFYIWDAWIRGTI